MNGSNNIPSVAEMFSLLQTKKERWSPGEDFPSLPGYVDAEGKEQPFLSGLVFTRLQLPVKAKEDCISFLALIQKNSALFLADALCFKGIDEEKEAECSLVWNKTGGITFSACFHMEGYEADIPKLECVIDSFTFLSGMETNSLQMPRFHYECKLKGKDYPINLVMDQAPGSRRAAAGGLCQGMGLMSVDDILSVFEINPADFKFCDELPDGIDSGLFEQLRLEHVSMEVGNDFIYGLTIGVSAGTTWNLLDFISITPSFQIQIFYPHDNTRRTASFTADAEWTLGKTVYELYADPYLGNLDLRMKEGQILDFAAVSKSFLNIQLPDLNIDRLGASLNYKKNSYAFYLGASDLWKFSILSEEFAVESVGLKVWTQKDDYDVVLDGSFLFFGAVLNLMCCFQNDDAYSVYASAGEDTEIKLSSFIDRFFDSGAISADIPDEFLDFNLHRLCVSYSKSSTDTTFELNASIEHILSITDVFVIDDFSIDTCMKNGRTERIGLGARFSIESCLFSLELKKREDGISLSGGSGPGQTIALGRLIEAFLEEMLGYQVALPEAISTFVISHIGFSYEDGAEKTSFGFECAAGFGGDEAIMRTLFAAGATIAVDGKKAAQGWQYGFKITSQIVIDETQVIICEYQYSETGESKNRIAIGYHPKNQGDEITFGEILCAIGFSGIDSSWAFLTKTGITRAEIAYDFTKNEFAAVLEITSGGSLKFAFTCGEGMEFQVIMASTVSVSLADIPVVGEMVQRFNPSPEKFSISDLSFYALSGLYATPEIPAGVRLVFKVCGDNKFCQIYEAKTAKRELLADGSDAPKTVWLKIEKTIAIFTLHRIGLALDGSKLGILADAGLSVSPLTFDMMGLGLYIDIGDFKEIRFALSGMGISLATPTVSIMGSFMKTAQAGQQKEVYAGSLAVTAAGFSAFAVGQYSDGSLMAYACINIPAGGPPALSVKGFALGFGYNEALKLPKIEEVASYPLVEGAMGRVSQSQLPQRLGEYISASPGQFFFAAGVHISTFEIADSFVLLTVSFGKKIQVGLLGLSEISMPPKCDTPIAYAKLAVRAAFSPDDGLFCAEALLMPESYVLSKDCKLTGGFAFYLWFKGEHAGDFVITLGGYHPAYKKPEHYPDVPRLGFRWDLIPKHPDMLVISGDMYFALTPSAIMAGGRLSAIFQDGGLRAWFTARADFLISWKPFHYDIEMGISLGASYRLDLWLIHCTFKIELGCDLHIWGPEFSGKAHVSWFIISFTIRFGAGESQKPEKIKWNEFAESFLPGEKKLNGGLQSGADSACGVNPLSTAVSKGVVGNVRAEKNTIVRAENQEEGIPAVCPEQFELSFTTVFPCTEVKVRNSGQNYVSFSGDTALFVRPMGVWVKESRLEAELVYCSFTENGETAVDVDMEPIKNSVPSALWAEEKYEPELVENVVCGIVCTAKAKVSPMFPQNSFISEELLSDSNIIKKENAFDFSKTWTLPPYESQGTVHYVTDTAYRLKTEGQKFLETMGYKGECDLSFFASDADNLLDEDIFTGSLV